MPGGDGYYSAILAMFKMQPIESPYANDNPEYINNVHENGYNPAAFSRDIAGYKDNLTRNANINAYAQYDFSFGLTAKLRSRTITPTVVLTVINMLITSIHMIRRKILITEHLPQDVGEVKSIVVFLRVICSCN